jgi:hypothetical protein
MEAVPSHRLGLFWLGMPLGGAINCILGNFGPGHTLKHNAKNPLRDSVVITIHEANTKLFFNSTSQDLEKLTVSHPWPDEVFLVQDKRRVRLCTNEEPLTFDQLKSFPLRLRQNTFRSCRRCQVVCSGIAFTFDPNTFVLQEISIFHGQSDANSGVPPPFTVFRPVGLYAVRFINLSRRTKMGKIVGVKVGLTYGARKELKTGDSKSIASDSGVEIEDFERHIMFGDMLQDVLTDLGAPERSCYQEKPSRLLARDQREVLLETTPSCDLYLNYESLGLDVVIKEKSQEVSQIVFHCNFPGHCDFHLYCRCPFQLDIPCCCHHIVNRKCPLNHMEHKLLRVTPVTKWTEISKHILCGDAHPIASLQRQSTTIDDNTFPGSTLFVFDQLVFEVMSNDHIATVTVLCDSLPTSCSSSDRSPHGPVIDSLVTIEDATALQAREDGQSVASYVVSGSVGRAKSKKSLEQPTLKSNESLIVLPESKEPVNTSQTDSGHHQQDGKCNSIIPGRAESKTFPCAHKCKLVPDTNTSSFNSESRNQLDDSSVQGYYDGFSAYRELARSPPGHASVLNGDLLVDESLLQQEQQYEANHCIVDSSEKPVSITSEPNTKKFLDAKSSPEGMRCLWSLSGSPDPAIHSLSSLISLTGKQDYLSWEDIDAVHTDVLCQLKRRAQVVQSIGNMWISGNPSRAVTKLCFSMGTQYEDNTCTNTKEQLLTSQDADVAAVINLLEVFNTNDSHFTVPVCLELLPMLQRLMTTISHLMEDK